MLGNSCSSASLACEMSPGQGNVDPAVSAANGSLLVEALINYKFRQAQKSFNPLSSLLVCPRSSTLVGREEEEAVESLLFPHMVQGRPDDNDDSSSVID